MRKLLLFAFAFYGTTAFAQINNDEVLQKKLEELKNKMNNKLRSQPHSFNIPLENFSIKGNEFSFGQPGVYALALDGMPCIVPDTKDIVSIPNAFKTPSVPFRSDIPNSSPLMLPPGEKIIVK
jgi:hypothetical protein